MSTVAALIDRAYREFLASPEEQPTRFTLAAEFASGAFSFTVDPDFLSPEEEALLAPGTVVEVNSELIQIGDYTEGSHVASSVKRAILGTAEATHASGDYGVIAPEYPRKVVFDAICDEIVGLYPDLYVVTATGSLSLSSTTYTEVAATVMEPMWLLARPVGSASTDPYSQYFDVGWYDPFPPSSTGKAIFSPFGTGIGYLVHKAKFARPGTEAVNLTTTTLLQEEWERIVLIGAVAYLIAGKDLSQRQQEFITQQLATQSYPVLTPTRIRESLLKYRGDLLERAKKGLRSRSQATVTRMAVIR